MKAHILDEKIAKMKQTIADLESQREKEMVESHTFTAEDFRLRIMRDECCDWEDKDMVLGSPPAKNESQKYKNAYARRLEAYKQGQVECYGYILERKNPATNEWDDGDEFGDSCWGFYFFPHNTFDELVSWMLENITLPNGIKATDIVIITE